MTDILVQQAYSGRSAEYTSALGAIDQMHALDHHCIGRWAELIGGRVLDAGCGPGHWTDFLHMRGVDVSGIDLVAEFVDGARRRFPDVTFEVSSLRHIDAADGSLKGVLAWYSLIHVPPTELPVILSELSRVLAPQGHLLIGFFEGDSAEPFDHAITTAYYWSVEQMTSLLHNAGFEVFDVETRQDSGSRPHAAISAIAR
ncbi:class I SAM-dependent methyltransferase [Paeniglutamicibacter sp.]|uniref:class I SAM-dependent methyltransferase n=1 Tax=Paeniglutamicibacter sp. TaxID=1934391 RepID=UPI0039891A42